MPAYATECLIDWPESWSGPSQVAAVASFDSETGAVTLESDDFATDLLSLPYGDDAGSEHAYHCGWVVHIPKAEGDITGPMDADLRTALREHHWTVK